MDYFYLAIAMTFSAAITVGGRLYNIKNEGGNTYGKRRNPERTVINQY